MGESGRTARSGGRPVRTSASHPLRIDALPAGSAGGQIGITFCPGKKGPSASGYDWDRDLEQDFHDLLNELVPNKPTFRHNKGDYGRNADAHLKTLLIGNSVTVPVTRGRLALGQWQVIYFSEFDGPRSRLVSIKVFGVEQ
jgi:hypothetical protein